MGKSLFSSKTFWAQIVGFLAIVAAGFGIDLGLTPETQATIAAGLWAAVNVVIRVITKEPIS